MNAVFVIGIQMRSGTNYLYDLLGKHGDCRLAGDIPEDFLVSESAYLGKYLKVMWSFWRKFDPKLVSRESFAAKLEAAVHGVLIDQVDAGDAGKLVVTKTPCSLGLDQLPLLFRNTKVIFLVRDGRSVTYSLQKSFSMGYFRALQRWQGGARDIRDFIEGNGEYFKSNCHLVRYEDLFSSTEDELRKVFGFLDIDPDSYDYEAASRSEVIGSSDLRNDGQKVEWSPKARDSRFDPLRRFTQWPQWKQRATEMILGEELRHFSYKCELGGRDPVALAVAAGYAVFSVASRLFPKNLKRSIKRRMLR